MCSEECHQSQFYKTSCRQINRKDSVIIMSVRPQAVQQELERVSRDQPYKMASDDLQAIKYPASKDV